MIDHAVSPLTDAYLALSEDARLFEVGLHKGASIITRRCATALGVSRASVWLFGQDNTSLSCVSLYVSSERYFHSGATVDARDYPRLFDMLSSSRIARFDDVVGEPGLIELADTYLRPLDIRSALAATLRDQGVAQGFVLIEMVGEQRDWSGDESMFIASVADLFSQCVLFERSARREAQHQALFEASNEGVLVFSGGCFADANSAMCRIYGGTRDEILGKRPVDFSPEFQPDGQLSSEGSKQYVVECLQGTPQMFEWRHKRLDGSEFDAEITLNAVRIADEDTLFAIVRDITERKEAERKERLSQIAIEYRATHDSLTGLLNRENLHTHVSTILQGEPARDPSFKLALLLFDLNRFKEVNDTLGHATGDRVLIQLANVLNRQVEALRGSVFRLGGDEFVAVFDNKTCPVPFADIEALLEECLKTPIDADDISIEMAASMGVAVYPDNGQDSHELLRCADVAMYHAKNNEGASSWYDPQNDLNNKRRLAMMVELGTAIRDDQLTLHFQPRIHVATGEVTGCEALIRWHHPRLGMVPPCEFIPLAEMSELIHPLSRWVLDAVLRQTTKLRDKGHDVPLAMNISARNLTDSQLVDTIEKRVASGEIDPRLLELEITESALINHPVRALQNLGRLHALGISLAIDDFGTGYSSLSYMKKLPVDTLKIDRSFVQDMLTDTSDAVIVSSTIQLAQNFSLRVVAEGVEDLQTLEALAQEGCDQAQGFFIARPMPAEALEPWLDDHPTHWRGNALTAVQARYG